MHLYGSLWNITDTSTVFMGPYISDSSGYVIATEYGTLLTVTALWNLTALWNPTDNYGTLLIVTTLLTVIALWNLTALWNPTDT